MEFQLNNSSLAIKQYSGHIKGMSTLQSRSVISAYVGIFKSAFTLFTQVKIATKSWILGQASQLSILGSEWTYTAHGKANGCLYMCLGETRGVALIKAVPRESALLKTPHYHVY